MNIFVDMHHGALYASLQRLFENRLGHNLFRPIGEEWATSGNWLLAKPYSDHPSTITQYLGIRNLKYDPYKYLNEVREKKDNYYVIADAFKDHKAVTLEQFKEMEIDIVIASYLPHFPIYKELVKRYHPKAKLILQMGNEWAVDFNEVKNILSSTYPFKVPSGVNAVFYHQEFDTGVYRYEKPQPTNKMRSFVHTLMAQDMFKQDWSDFLTLQSYMPEYLFESFGAACRDGVVSGDILIAEKMRASFFGIHEKQGGDGYGYVIHQWAASGRPLIYRGSQYTKRLASKLLVNLVTGIDLDMMSIPDASKLISGLSPEQHELMCENVYNRFRESVDFNKETEDIKLFLERLN